MPKRYLTVEEKRELARNKLARTASVLGPNVRYEFIPNNMASGPCAACLSAAEHSYLASEAPIAPLEGCPHPDQCVGFHRSLLALDEVDEDEPPAVSAREEPRERSDGSGWAHFFIGLFGG